VQAGLFNQQWLIERAVLGQQLRGLVQKILHRGTPDYQFC
jgi:hypothetical protein